MICTDIVATWIEEWLYIELPMARQGLLRFILLTVFILFN